MSHQSQLEKSKYRNWVRGGLAYRYLKEGIEGFADDVVQKEHTRIVGAVNNTSGKACDQCDLNTLKPIHTHVADQSTGRKMCPRGQFNCNCLYPRKKPCPNKVCDDIMEEILKSHGSTPPTPNWKNTDVQKWYTSPLEIAKCFINAPGYLDKTSAADIDINGLLHVFINNINLHTHLSCNMTGTNIFMKCRETRNKLFHSPEMELEDTKLTECIDDIIAILEDPKELAVTADAQQAVSKLKQLKQQDFIITTHSEAEVCRDALDSITNKTIELNQMIQDAKDDIDRKHADASKAIDDKIQTDLQNALAENSDINLLKKNVEILFQIVDNIKGDMRQIKKHLEEIDKVIGDLKAVKDLHMEKMKYIEQKQALQDGLVKLYQRHYVKTSLSPLKHRENDINIDEVYVSPNMVVVEADKQQYGADNSRIRTGQQEYWDIHEYHDLFQSDGQSGFGNSRRETGKHKERYIHGYHDLFQSEEKENIAIYIVGDFGAGKSSFCKKMIQDWCKAATENWNISVSTHGGSTSCEMTDNSNTIGALVAATNESKQLISDETVDSNDFSSTSGSDSEIESLDSDFELHFSDFIPTLGSDLYQDTFDDNIYQMKTFEFLFYIPLCKMSKYRETFKMIQEICTKANLASANLIEKVFEQDSERCLIVIDGLDEWNPEKIDDILSHESSGLPSKHGINNATVVTLSRPSAKGMLNIKKSEIDQKVELKGICRSSLHHFITKYFPKLKKTHISAESFMKNIKQSKLKHLENTPLLLQQLVWMYCNEIDFGKTVSDIYSHLINIMFGWLQRKTDSNDSEDDFSDNAEQYNQMTLPKVLNSFERCEKNTRLLIQIAKFAFESFTSEPEKNLFSRLQLKNKGFSEIAILSLIEVGLLVEENCYDPTYNDTQLSFIHFSYLEFFAAVYASCRFDDQKSNDKICSEITELFPKVKTAADILQLSNLLKMICGLCPFVITQVSLFISDLVKRDEKLIRQNSEKLRWDSSLHQIQKLIFSFLSERDTTVRDEPMVYIADVLINDSTKMSAIKSIIPDNVITFHASLACNKNTIWEWMTQLKYVQYLYIGGCFLYHDLVTMLCSLIEEAPLRCISLKSVYCHNPDCRGHSVDLSKHDHLQKLMMNHCNIKISNISTEHLEAITLDFTETLDISLLQNARCLTQLSHLQYTGIGSFTRYHDQLAILCSFLQETPLRCISLEHVKCQQPDCRGHSIDLSKHDHLQELTIRKCNGIKISYINTKHLETIHLDSTQTLDIGLLQNSRRLSELQLGSDEDWLPLTLTYNRDIDTVVHTLHQLQKLRIACGDIDENALTVTPEMRNLKHIKLHFVKMSLATWCTFVDSLLTLQQSVQVDKCYNSSAGSSLEYLKEKKKYVEEKENIFEIIEDGKFQFLMGGEKFCFHFRTRKQ